MQKDALTWRDHQDCALVMMEFGVELQEEKMMRKYLQSLLESEDCAEIHMLCSKRKLKLEAPTPRKVSVTLVRRGAGAELHGLGRAADATSRRTRLAAPELQASRATNLTRDVLLNPWSIEGKASGVIDLMRLTKLPKVASTKLPKFSK